MPDKPYSVVGLGELLWDVFPKGKELGGAPANFAYMTSLLGDHGIVASRVGSDALGRTAGRRLERIGLRSKYLQLDTQHATGTVRVEVDPAGQPTFEIAESVAWDFFEWTPEWERLASIADSVCFGSLAQRSPQSRATIRAFLKEVRRGTTRVFDVNLRQAFYSADTLAESMKLTDIVKLNQEELPIVVKLLGHAFQDQERAARWLRDTYSLQLVCVTRGAKGSLLVSGSEISQHPGCRVVVADTVGSGDAFTAALVYHYLRRASLATLNEAANRMGAWVASQTGATPPRDDYYLQQIRTAVSGEE
jgi:fructokinase